MTICKTEYILNSKTQHPFSFLVTTKYPIHMIKTIMYKGDTASLDKSSGKVIMKSPNVNNIF